MFYGSMHFFIHSYPGAVLRFLSVIGLTEILAVPHAHQLKNFIASSKRKALQKVGLIFCQKLCRLGCSAHVHPIY
ncbi:hypothetical protein E0M21_26930 [Bacillus cereus]|nr:hypothetical protein E0M21_26930 [Bacillus cereus]